MMLNRKIACGMLMMILCLTVFEWSMASPVKGAIRGGSDTNPFYGIWCEASKDEAEIQETVRELCVHGYDARVFLTTDWSNLNGEMWYVVTAGVYLSEEAATASLPAVQTLYADAYVKYSGEYLGWTDNTFEENGNESAVLSHPAFYGIWCQASKDGEEIERSAAALREQGLDARVYVTTDWDNLNRERWYVVSAGIYESEEDAKKVLPKVQTVYPDAYVKYSGEYRGEDRPQKYEPDEATDSEEGQMQAFYGVWCQAAREREDAEKAAADWVAQGFDAHVLRTTDWGNLNRELWYAVTVGLYESMEEAERALPAVQQRYPDAYVKYSGQYNASRRTMYTIFTENNIVEGDSMYYLVAWMNDDGNETILTVDSRTVFDESCDMVFFENYNPADSVLEWFQREYALCQNNDTSYNSGLKGVFDVLISGSHVDRIYGIYWWD